MGEIGRKTSKRKSHFWMGAIFFRAGRLRVVAVGRLCFIGLLIRSIVAQGCWRTSFRANHTNRRMETDTQQQQLHNSTATQKEEFRVSLSLSFGRRVGRKCASIYDQAAAARIPATRRGRKHSTDLDFSGKISLLAGDKAHHWQPLSAAR